MDYEDAVGCVAYGGAKDFARVHKTVAECANGDLMTGNRLILAVERDHMKFFLPGITG